MNIASLGLSALTCEYANNSSKVFGSRATYLYNALRSDWKYRKNIVPLEYTSQTLDPDGEPLVQSEPAVYLLSVCNGRFFGGGMKIAPMADPTDGEFDVVLLRNISWWHAALTLSSQIYSGNHVADQQRVKHWKTRELSVRTIDSAAERVLVECDGENVGFVPVVFAMQPRTLRLVVPEIMSFSSE